MTHLGEVLRIFCYVCLVALSSGRGSVEVEFQQFSNAAGETYDGHCCDGRWAICQSGDGCDHKFTICLHDDMNGQDDLERSDCQIFVVRTAPYVDQNNIVFHGSIAGLSSPIKRDLEHMPETMLFKTQVYDQDVAQDDFVDFLRLRMGSDDVDMTYHDNGRQFYVMSRTTLLINIRSWCDDHYYGRRCEIHCLPPSPGQHYSCNEETGLKQCQDGWSGDACEISEDYLEDGLDTRNYV